MIIMHIFPYEKYTTQFVNFINQEYSQDEHRFIIHGNISSLKLNITHDSNVVYIAGTNVLAQNKELMKELKECDKIIVHSLFSLMEWEVFHLSMLKKTYVQFWGADIYNMAKPVHGITNHIMEWIRRYQIRHVKGIITQIEGDYKVLQSYERSSGKHYLACYPFDPEGIKKQLIIRNTNKTNSPVKIILGNSATASNGHIEILEKLKVYKNEDFVIHCPLSYGEEEYRNKVIKRGKELFGYKFIPLVDFMDVESYWELLNQCNIGIFNVRRQQALANINSIGLFGGKVYLRNDTGMWEDFVVDKQYDFFDIEEIGQIGFDDLCAISDRQQQNNYDKIMYYNTDKGCKPQWDRIFNA